MSFFQLSGVKPVTLIKSVLFLSVFIYSKPLHCQEEQADVDRGAFHDYDLNLSDNNITVPLLTVEMEGCAIPIYLSYNTSGMRHTDEPSSVGYGWQLNGGGKISKTINHIPDESPRGWLFNNAIGSLQNGFYQGGYGTSLYESIDSMPDLFTLSVSNGSRAEFVFSTENQNIDELVIDQNMGLNDVHVDLSKLADYSDYPDNAIDYLDSLDSDFNIQTQKGISYLFRRGIKKELPWDVSRERATFIDSLYYDNFYLHKVVSDQLNESIDFTYLETPLKKYVVHGKGTEVQTNSDPRTPPEPSDPVITTDYQNHISVQDVSRKDVTTIIGPRQRVSFKYIPAESIGVDGIIRLQDMNLLDEIDVFDYNGDFIFGYKFEYTDIDLHDDQESPEGQLKLKRILRYAKNKQDHLIYREFAYNDQPPIYDFTSQVLDVFGYPNGVSYNHQSDITPVGSDKSPNETEMLKGMLISMIHEDGGSTHFTYKENSYGDFYYGGLLVTSKTVHDSDGTSVSKTNFSYEEPEGYGFAVYDQSVVPQGGGPGEYPEYEEGHIHDQHYEWETYFTKTDRKMRYYNYGHLTSYVITNTPFALMRNTSATDPMLQNMGFSNFNEQITSGSFYKKVTTTTLNPQTNEADHGHTVRFYRPSFSAFRLDSKLERVETYNAQDELLKSTQYNREFHLKEIVNAKQFDNTHFNDGSYNYGYIIRDHPISVYEDVLRSKTVTDIYQSGTREQTSTYTYLGEGDPEVTTDHSRVKSMTRHLNGTPYLKTEYLYFSEVQGDVTEDGQYLWLKNPVVETSHWAYSDSNDWTLENATVNYYDFYGKTTQVGVVGKDHTNNTFYTPATYTPAWLNGNGLIESVANDFITYSYDMNGRIRTTSNTRSNVSTHYQWGEEYKGLYSDAVLTSFSRDVSSQQFLKKSFEDITEPDVVLFDRAYSGNNVFSGATLELGEFPNGHQVTFWAYDGTTWQKESYTHTGGEVTITKPTSAMYIDEVRVFPPNAIMETRTFDTGFGPSSVLDHNGRGTHNMYDIFGTPAYILDQDFSVLSEYRKNRANSNN